MTPELNNAVDLFVHVATGFQKEPRPPMGDSFEEWTFWQVPASRYFRSARTGVAQVDVPTGKPLFDVVLWQSLLEHPDLVIERDGACLGIECKSLRASTQFTETGDGIPCRTTIDFNSTVPCGREKFKGKFEVYAHLKDRPLVTFYALRLYGSVDGEDRVISFVLVDGNYINRDFELHRTHRNISRSGFGSYGDGKIRERKMYLFPNPLTDEALRGSVSLVVEQSDGDLVARYPQLKQMMIQIKTTTTGQRYPFCVYHWQG